MTCPIDLSEANAFVEKYHRHHKKVVGHKFSIGAVKDDKSVGVVIVGRPRVDKHTLGLRTLWQLTDSKVGETK